MSTQRDIDFYEKIVLDVNSDPSIVFDKKPFYKLNDRLLNRQRYQVSYNASPISMLDINDIVFNAIRNEINMNITKRVLNKLVDTKLFECVDMRGKDLDMLPMSDVHLFCDRIIGISEGYKNIVTTGRMAALIQDCAGFAITTTQQKIISSGGDMYLVGSLNNVFIWVDPIMRWNDDRIILFNDVDIYFENMRSAVRVESNFAPIIRFEYDLLMDDVDSKIVYIVQNESSMGWSLLKEINRDLKLNEILGEKEK